MHAWSRRSFLAAGLGLAACTRLERPSLEQLYGAAQYRADQPPLIVLSGVHKTYRTGRLESVALFGWMVAIPAGWLIGWSLVRVISEMFKFGSIAYSFPVWYPLLALPATLVLAYLVVIAPVRRAARVRPGDALRYE